MSRIEELRQVTDQTLHGLTADDSLKFRILQQAAGGAETKKPSFRPVPVLCAACAALLVMILALNSLQPVSNVPGEINVFAAGSTEKPADMDHTGLLPPGFEAGSVVSVELDGAGSVTNPEKCAALAGILDGQVSSSEYAYAACGSHLKITAADGTVLTFGANEPYLIAEDGSCWSCPEFFTELRKEIE